MCAWRIADLLIWEDPAILVVRKPAKLPTLPDGYHPDAPCLINLLSSHYPTVMVVHRLDKETSGLLVLALTPEAHRNLNMQFERRQVTKRYQALVRGEPAWDHREARFPLLKDGDRRHRTIIDHRRGQEAHTSLNVHERFKGFALVEAIPHTGRTHQIRAHLAHLGFPILVDRLYGDGAPLYRSQLETGYRPKGGDERPLIDRLCLHAGSLEFTHPTDGTPSLFSASFPEDFESALRHLRQPLA